MDVKQHLEFIGGELEQFQKINPGTFMADEVRNKAPITVHSHFPPTRK